MRAHIYRTTCHLWPFQALLLNPDQSTLFYTNQLNIPLVGQISILYIVYVNTRSFRTFTTHP